VKERVARAEALLDPLAVGCLAHKIAPVTERQLMQTHKQQHWPKLWF
jgi:hypothetical protein